MLCVGSDPLELVISVRLSASGSFAGERTPIFSGEWLVECSLFEWEWGELLVVSFGVLVTTSK